MTPEQFVYWLQGYFELTNSNELTTDQVKMIREHLALVFVKVTSPLGDESNPVYTPQIPYTAPWPFSKERPIAIC